jgi:hypothetical protein
MNLSQMSLTLATIMFWALSPKSLVISDDLDNQAVQIQLIEN